MPVHVFIRAVSPVVLDCTVEGIDVVQVDLRRCGKANRFGRNLGAVIRKCAIHKLAGESFLSWNILRLEKLLSRRKMAELDARRVAFAAAEKDPLAFANRLELVDEKRIVEGLRVPLLESEFL